MEPEHSGAFTIVLLLNCLKFYCDGRGPKGLRLCKSFFEKCSKMPLLLRKFEKMGFWTPSQKWLTSFCTSAFYQITKDQKDVHNLSPFGPRPSTDSLEKQLWFYQTSFSLVFAKLIFYVYTSYHEVAYTLLVYSSLLIALNTNVLQKSIIYYQSVNMYQPSQNKVCFSHLSCFMIINIIYIIMRIVYKQLHY